MTMLRKRPLYRLGGADFVLRTLVVTAMAYAVEVLGEAFLHLNQLSHFLYALQYLTVFGLVGTFWFRSIDERLLDAGLAHSYRYPVYALWLASTSLPAIWPQESLFGLFLFVLILIFGFVTRGEHAPVKSAAREEIAQFEKESSALPRKAFHLPPVDRVSFLRSLLTLACLWLPLIWLEDVSNNHIGAWIARFLCTILSVVWAVKVVGRLDDIGKAPNVRQVVLFIFLVATIGLMIRLRFSRWSEQWQSSPEFIAAEAISQWFRRINGYEKLALFLLIQTPLTLMPSEPRPSTLVSEPIWAKDPSLGSAPTNMLSLCGPVEFLRILLVIAGLCGPLIYMDRASNNGVGSWIARAGYAILVFFWLTFAHGRLKDAGWAHSEYPSQYFLVVSVASLVPFAVHWVSGYGALAIFVIVQIPTVLLKSVPLADDES